MTGLRLACLQGPGDPAPPDGLMAGLARRARAARARGANLVVTSEMALTGYAVGEAAVARLAEPLDGPRVAALADIARETGLAIVAGLPERDGERIYNAAILLGPDGALRAAYRKTHLFGEVDRAQFAAGAAPPPVVEFGGLRVGLLICYDVEFPESVRLLALAGADLVLVPTALMAPFEFVSEGLLPARAFENQLFMAYVNRCDREGAFDYCGSSCIVGPDGRDLARAGRGEETILADLDPALLAAARRANTHLADRRPDLYGALLGAPAYPDRPDEEPPA